MAVEANSRQINFQDPKRSAPVRKNFNDKDAEVNDLQSQLNSVLTPPAGNEVTNARDAHVTLRERLRSATKANENQVITGFDVLEQAVPDMTIKVKAGEAIANGVAVVKGFGTWDRVTTVITMTELSHGLINGDNIFVDVSSDAGSIPLTEYIVANKTTDTFEITGVDTGAASGTVEYSRYSGTITAPTNKRWDVVVIDSGNTISIVSGNDSNDRIFPAISISQRPIALIDMDSATATITDSLITDISKQGCITGNKWYFNIQDAVDSLNDRTQIIEQGNILIRKGDYYEEVDLIGKNNISLIFENGAKMYRVDDTTYCIKSINTVGNETVGIKIIGADLYGNGKAGAIELLKFDYTDEFMIKDCRFDSNNSSSATYKNFLIDNADNFKLNDNLILDNSGDIDYTTTNISNATNYMEDGYYKDQVTMCGVTAQKAQMLKMGWVELTAMDDKFLRIDKDTAGSAGGSDTMAHTHNHNHNWYNYTNNENINDASYDINGAQRDIVSQTYGLMGANKAIRGGVKSNIAGNESLRSHFYTGLDATAASNTDNKPAYYSLIALIHR